MREGQQAGDRVFVRDEVFAWLPATIVACEHDRVQVTIDLPTDWQHTTESASSPPSTKEERWINLDNYRDRVLPMQNVGGRSTRDCADLPHLHEAAILYQIKERHATLQPYTRVGDIVVAVNPCKWVRGLYSVHQGVSYAKNFVWQLETSPGAKKSCLDSSDDNGPITSTSFGSIYNKLGIEPHVYEVSALAYRGMFLDRKDQTILVSGESGAGKTETVKIVLHHLATLETASLLVDSGEWPTNEMVDHIVAGSPVFESFGNAQTVRNHNSSRFGKMTRLHFGFASNGMCALRGSSCQTYLLETNRVVSQAPGERNFHIFYQLMAAPRKTKAELLGASWENATSNDFLYLNGTASTDHDAKMWTETQNALAFFQWRGDKLKSLFQALAAILRLGNIVFSEDQLTDGCLASPVAIEQAAEILGLPPQTLDHALRHRTIQTAGERVDAQLTPANAKDALDTLVRKIYGVVFQAILESINEQTRDKDFEEEDGIINLLDIYGFEAFETNRFEQLCINYANEMLHKQYIDDNFSRFQEEYEEEGIELPDFNNFDNSDVLSLLHGPKGVIEMVNEECVVPNGSSEKFVQKLKKEQKGQPRFISSDLLLKTEFGIKHFAAPVVYDASEFVERNMHRLPSELLHVISKTTNEMISKYFKSVLQGAVDRLADPKPALGRKRSSKKAVLERFRFDLQGLMDSMKGTQTRYIRCVKPNESLTPGKVNHCTVMRQLECAGLVTAIDLSRETYPNKLSLEAVADRFGCLLSASDHVVLGEMWHYDKVQYMLSKLYAPYLEVFRNAEFTMPYACGKTKVYFRSGALEMLEALRFEYFSTRATLIQAGMRRWLAIRLVQRAWKGLISMQSVIRGFLKCAKYRSFKSGVVSLQSNLRRKKERRWFMTQRAAAVLIQSRWRFRRAVRRRHLEFFSSITMASFFRKTVCRNRFVQKRSICTRLQALVRGRFIRTRFEYVIWACIRLQNFARYVIAKNATKSRSRAIKTIGAFGRDWLLRMRHVRASVLLQTATRRHLHAKRLSSQRKAAVVVQAFFLTTVQRMKFISIHKTTIKTQAILRMWFAEKRFRIIRRGAVKIQSFCRMVGARMAFVTAYLATLKIQAFFRMVTACKNYQCAVFPNHAIQSALSSDMSEIYTIATGDSRDASASKNLPLETNPTPDTFRKLADGTKSTKTGGLSIHESLLGPTNIDGQGSMTSGSIPSVASESDDSSSDSSEHVLKSEEPRDPVSSEACEEDDKDLLIQKLGLELEDMKEQERILREEIAGVVDLAKEHEQMVGEEHEDRIQAYEDEVVHLKKCLRQSDAEKEGLKSEIEKLQQTQAKELEAFQKHAQAAQESHKEYIQNVSAVLDDANEARQIETARILAELDSVKQTKDKEIRKLRSEIQLLRTNASGRTKRGTSSREQENRKAELLDLQHAIMGAIKPSRVVKVVERAQRRPWSKEAFIHEKVSLRVGQHVARLLELATSSDAEVDAEFNS